ncbi:MAG TPA: avidin/streptavidin family protein [Paraburkholderia sp.]|uniref:avidin/streptavidin family protein n=1 Tax=Paraburkholderia sp. TaxID=1926495 RepID=UPI002B48B310|nr:avidin/streptavidin family protein [Paraburkholderia sp.]HKR42414.1 avidin/streptavidin family protein [Paraburkholderia sp.]
MNKRITFSVALGLALLSTCASLEAKPPTCNQPVGKWKNGQKSVLNVKTYDAATGAISGEYISHSGASAGSTPYPVAGWINSAPVESSASGKAGKGDHTEVITFAVRWGKLGSVSAWTGTCGVNSQSFGAEQISALWHTTRSNTGFEWDHTLTGSDRFDPIE